ncbi:LysR family transcriptional regulator [Novosphingobium sp. MW5]|nr:LysR family transcriptional regulator [Novosphingobium sp. MW5]
MRLDKFDLNLLLAFEVLIEERNVTRAARRLNLTQSAMSGALKRLRDAFSDEILVQQGKKMFPTAAALALAPEVSSVIADLRRLIAQGMAFDPQTSERKFRVITSDYIAIVLIGPLLERLQHEAPRIRLELTHPSADVIGRLDDGTIDLVIAPERFLAGDNPRDLLLEERHVVVGWTGNPALGEPLTRETYESVGHVVVDLTKGGTFAENFLREHSDRRRVEVSCPDFSSVGWLLPGTNRVALMHERLARIMARFLPLRICEPPVDLPVMREMILYHRANAEDPALSWLRKRLKEIASSI